MILLSSMLSTRDRGAGYSWLEVPDFSMLADRSGDQGQDSLLDMHLEESVTYF